MNYAGKFDGAISSEGPGNHSHFVHLNPGHTHAPADSIVVPDAHFLFNADFKRAGVDLVLSKDGHDLVLHDYFKTAKHAALSSPDGAHLTADIVDALTGYVQVAQAGGPDASASHVIGHVTKLQGSATVIRNGVSIILNMGDNVEKGDVVQSGSGSALGITFIDGTVFGLSANSRMVLNEMVYDPNGSNNSSLMSLVAGTITFVAGETAKHGDMKIDTPAATMGIRGTAGLVILEIDFQAPAGSPPNASFQVLVEPDGTTGSYILYDKATLQPLYIVNQAGVQANISNGIVTQTQNPLSPDQLKLINETFTQKFTDNNNQTTKTASTIGSSTADGTQGLNFDKNGGKLTVVVQNQDPNAAPKDKPPPSTPTGSGDNHHLGTLTLQSVNLSGTPQLKFATSEISGQTNDALDPDHVGGTFQFADANVGDRPIVKADFLSVTYANADGSFTVGAGQVTPPTGLSALQLADINATAVKLLMVPDLGNTNNGTYTWLYSVQDNQFDFLGDGETLTYTYHVTADVVYNGVTETQALDVTIVVTGTNDQPVITTDSPLIHFAAGTGTSGGSLVAQNGDATSGTFAFTDVDLTDTHTLTDTHGNVSVIAELTTASLDGMDKAALEALAPGPMADFENALKVQLAQDSTGTGNGTINWQLTDLPVFDADFIPLGEKLVLTYTVTVTDEHGSTSQKDITVEITGTNAAATVWIHTTDDGHDGNWTTGANWGTGKAPTSVNDVIIVTDQLHPKTPAYPATITTGTQAAANSVVMNDFVAASQTIPPELKLETGSSLTIGTTLRLSADSILTNAGTVNVGTQLELLDEATNPVTPVNKSVITNSGTINIGQGGDILGLANVTNSGTIELQAGTLNLDVNVANSAGNQGGNINIDSGAKIVLGTDVNSGGVTGGTVTVKSGGELDLTGNNVLKNGTLANGNQVNVTGTGNKLDGETVSNSGTLEVKSGDLTIDQTSNVTNTGTIKVDSGAKLTVDSSTISGAGTITDNGDIELTGGAVLSGGTLGNTATLNVTGTGNKLDGETVSNSGTLEVKSGDLTIDQTSNVTNTGTIKVDSGAKLTVDSSTISGAGTITDNGDIELTGGAVLSGGTLGNTATLNVTGTGNKLDGETVSNSGTLEVKTGDLTIDQTSNVTNTGTIKVDGGAKLTVNASTISGAGTVTNNGDIELTDGAVLTGGTLGNTATLNVTGTGNKLDGETVSNSGTLEVKTGDLTIDQTSNVTNTGTIKVDGGAKLTVSASTISGAGTVTNNCDIELTDHAVVSGGTLGNTATLNVTGTGNKLDGETVSNSGTLEVKTGDLTIDQTSNVTNTGTMKVDSGAKLTVNASTIDGAGTVTNGGELDLTAGAVLKNGTLANNATLEVSGTGNALHNETVTSNSMLEVLVGAALTLDQGTSVANSGGTVKVDTTATLTLNSASITDGMVTNAGTINSTGGVEIEYADINNTGTIESTAGLLTIDGGSSAGSGPSQTFTLTNSNMVKADGGQIYIIDEQVTNTGTLEAVNHGTLELTGLTVTNKDATHNGTVTIDGTSELDLSNASVTGGQLGNAGTLKNVTGNNTISAAVTNTGTIDVHGGSLNLSGGLIGVGTLDIDGGTTLEIAGADAQTVTFTGGTGTLQLDNTSIPFTGTITGQSSTAGNFTVKGAANITTASGDALDFNASNGTSGAPATVTANMSGALNGAAGGIAVIQNGTGDVNVTTSGAVTGNAGSGILAEVNSSGSGNVVVTATGSVTGKGAGNFGILAENLNAADGGDVTVTSTGGATGALDAIEALAKGSGDISVTAGGAINAASRYGIRAQTTGTGSVSVLTNAGTVINSGGEGISANNNDTTTNIPVSANASVTVTNHATINFGPALNPSGSAAKGIDAGFFNNGVASTSINGTVLVDNFGDVTQTSGSGGTGVNAYNYGNGDVTIHEEAGTTVSASAIGIGAFAQSGGSGNVTITVGDNVSVTGQTSYGVQANATGVGNVSVTIGNGDTIISGGYGVLALNQTTSISSAYSVTVNVGASTITSGSQGGINAGYYPGANNIAPNVHGNVSVTSNATIVANGGGIGINAFNWGTGDVTVTTQAASSITASGTGVNATANDGGNVSVTHAGTTSGTTGLFAKTVAAGTVTIENDGTLTGTTLSGISVNQNAAGATGSTTITNTGTVTGGGSNAAIFVAENATGTATITNTGTIGATGASVQAIGETGGHLVINNDTLSVDDGHGGHIVTHGAIDGAVNAATTTFTNEAGATWNAVGTSTLGASSTIDNSGTISLASATISDANGLTITNEAGGVINGASGTNLISGATINNAGTIEATGGTLTIDLATQLTITNTGTLEAITGGTLKLTNIVVTNSVTDGQGTHDGTVSTDNASFFDLDASSITGGHVNNAGTIYSTGASTINAAIDNGGTIEISTGTLTLSGTITGAGHATIDGGAVLELSNIADGQDITFGTAGGELIIDSTASLTGNIGSLDVSDKIDLQVIDYASATASYNGYSGVLTVTDGDGDSVALTIGTGFDNAHFAASADGGSGTLITLSGSDDAPDFTQTNAAAAFSERAGTTDSLGLDPLAPQTANGTLDYTDMDLTDRSTVTLGTPTVVDAQGHDISGSFTAGQLAALQNGLTVTPHAGNATHNNGAVDWSYSIADGSLDFLSEGQTVVVKATVTVTDNFGQSGTSEIDVTITGANDAPSITFAPAGGGMVIGTTENTTAPINGLSVSDVDGGASVEQLTVSVGHGGLSLTTTTGLTGDLNGSDGSLTLTGSLANINAALATLKYTPGSNYSGSDNLHLSLNDQAPNGAALTTTKDIGITVAGTGTNHAPTDISLTNSSVAENSAAGTVVGVLSDVDPDAGDSAVYTLVDNAGGLFAISNGNLVVAGALDHETTPSAQVTVRVTDSAQNTYDKTFTINVTDVDEKPTVTSGATGTVTENAPVNTVVYTVQASDPDTTAPNKTLSYSLSGTDANLFNINATTGDVTLKASANYEAKAAYSINVVATDGGNLSDSKAVTISVTDVNEGPTVTSGATGTVAENAPVNTVVYTVQASDPDTTAPNKTLSYSLSGTDANLFNINATTGEVTLKASANYEAKAAYSINVVATDGGNLSDSKAVTISVTDVNEGPTVTSGATGTVAENAPVNTVVYTVQASDPDTTAPNKTLSYSLSGTDANLFNINATTGEVTLKASANYEAKAAYSINVVATDGGNLSDTKAVTISVTDLNEGPTVTSGATGTVAENAPVNTVVYTVQASDPDTTAPNKTLSYSLSGTDANLFNINAITGEVTLKASANYEAKAAYSINVVATDGGNLSDSKAVTISVTDVNEGPTVTSGATGTVAENAPINTVVYTVQASDPDTTAPNKTLSYSLSGTDANLFNINATTGEVTLKASANYEAKAAYSINVVATDGGNLSDTKAVTISVTDVNEGPTVASGATGTVAENAPVNTVVYTVQASDPDTTAPNKTLSYSLSGTDANLFNINATTGEVTLKASANYEAKASYSINVVATDGGNLSDSKAVTISVTDVNEGPTVTSGATGTVAENAPVNTVVYTVQASDPDTTAPNKTLSYSLSGTDANLFNINATTGEVTLKASADYETKNAYSINVVATDGGNLSDSKPVTINVTDVAGVTLTGDDGPNTLVGTPEADVLNGAGGNDRLQGFGANDQLNGGLGFDRAIYTDATGGIAFNLTSGTVTGPGVGTDTLTGIEGIVGTNFADTYTAVGFTGDTGTPGTPIGFNEFEGAGGDDIITGAVNSQGAFLTRVSFLSATGGVTVNLSTGKADGDASVGHDTFTNVSNVLGSNFADTLTGSNNPFGTVEVFEGRGGDDIINGGGGFDRADYINDPAETHGITVNLAAGTVTGSTVAGNDTLRSIEAVRGTAFADTFDATGFSGTSTNAGSFGTFNEFTGGGGNDTIIGNGNTRISFNNATSGVTVDLQTGATPGTGTADGDASVGHDTFSGVNAVQGSMFADTIFGSNNTAATETFTGNGGDDYIDGRGGFDIASYNNIYLSSGSISVDMAAGIVTGDSSIGTDTLRSIEGIQGTVNNDTYVATGFGTAGALNIGNNGTFNQFEGLAGDDTVTGNGNTRVIYSDATGGVAITIGANGAGSAIGDSSTGHDIFNSGVNSATGSNFADSYVATGFSIGSNVFNSFQGLAGDDTITGNGATQVQYGNATTSGVTITINAGGAGSATSADSSIGNDTFTGGVNSAIGTNFADSYNASAFGSGLFNSFQGNAGNDTITGNGATQIIYANATAGVIVNLATGIVTGDGSVGTDTITGGVNSVFGSNFNDVITGGPGNDFLNGNGGDDTLIGGAGNDNLTGGLGADTFVYATGGGADFINDFTHGQNDRIDLSGVNGVFSLADVQTHATQVGSNTVIDFGNGDTLTLANVTATNLVAGDFVFSANHAPTDISLTNSSVAENSPVGTIVGTLSDVDADAGDSASFTLLDNAGGLFAIDHGNLVVAGALDYETAHSQQVTVRVTDSGNNTYDKVFTIGITDVAGVTLTGDDGPNTLVGTSEADVLNGAGGNDRLQGLGDNDQLNGGLGFDRAVYTDATGGITVHMAAGTVTGAGVGTDTLTGVEGIVGSDFADTFDATGFLGSSGLPGVANGQTDFEGRGGDDVIIGYVNQFGQALTRVNYLSATGPVTVDLAQGKADGDVSVGHDTFSNVFGVFGSAYGDTIYGSNNPNFTYESFEGRGGNDYIDGRGGYDIVTYNNDLTTTTGIVVDLGQGIVIGDATVGTDTLRDVEAVRGTNFHDVIDARGYGLPGALNVSSTNGTFNDVAGAGGDDTIYGNGNTRLNYQLAAASVSVDLETSAIGTTTAVTVAGVATGTTEGTDTFTGVNAVQGSIFNDTLLGSSFNNTFTGLGGDDYIDGRGGFDIASYNSFSTVTSGVNVQMAAGTAIGDASIGTDTLRNIEGIQGTMLADTYNAAGYGAAGALNVSTSNGTFNQFEGLGGDDTITGNGNTRVIYSNATGGVAITIGANGAGSATGDSSTGHDIFNSGVNSAIGSNFADTYNASAFNNGFNSFQGNSGDDTITGNGATQVQYGNAATSGVTITINAGGAGSAISSDSLVGHDTFTGGVNSALGSNFADSYNASLFGSGLFNSFQGNAGNDTITGNGSTQIIYTNATAGVLINLATGTATGDGSVGTDTITGGVNSVLGSNFNDVITGTAGNDVLNGNGGNDVLIGGAGNDNLTGGAGADTFVYANGGGADFINDFNHGQGDRIDLTGVSGIYTLADVQAHTTQVGSNTVIDFGGGNTITLANVTATNLVASDFLFPAVNITVYAPDGLDFDSDPNPLTEMGSGTVHPGGTTTYTVVNTGSLPHFVFNGYGFTYDVNGNVTGGTITAIHEFAADGSPIADFTGQFNAVQWMSGVQQANAGDFTAINTLVANYNFNFVGGPGPDNFGGAGHSENLQGGGGNDVLDPNGANGGTHTLTGGAGADTFKYQAGYGAVTITDFDQGNGGVFNPTEGDQIKLSGLSQPVSITQVGANTLADYGNGDVLTFLNMTPAQVQSISGVVLVPGNGVAYTNGTLGLSATSSQSFKVAGTAISSSTGPGVNLAVNDATATDTVVLDIDAASSISSSATGAQGIAVTSTGANIDLVNNASVTTSGAPSTAPAGAVGINVSKQGEGSLTLINTGNIFAGSSGIVANNNTSTIGSAANAFIFVSNFGQITAGPSGQPNNQPANGIFTGFGNGGLTNTWGTVVVDNNADITATAGTGSGIASYNNSNGNITVNEGADTTVRGTTYAISATTNNRGSNGTNGLGNATSGDVTINLSQNVTLVATNSYGIFAQNLNNGSGNVTITMAAGDVITSGGSGINVYDGATSLTAGTILVNAEGTIHSGTTLNGTGGQPAGILAGYLGTANGIAPSAGNFPVVGLNGNVIINSAADIIADAGDGIRGYTYGATGNVTINATAGTIVAKALANTTNGNGNGISAQDNGGGNIFVTTAAGVSIKAAGSGISANNGDNGNAVAVTGQISVIAYGQIESGTNPGILSGSGNLTAGILAGYNASGSAAATPNVHGNVFIDDHALITADVGDGIRGYNYGTGDVVITVESDSIINGARYGVGGFTFGGGHVSLTNYGSISGSTDAIDVNVNGSITPSGTATIDNHGHVNGNILALNATFINELGADWAMNGSSTFSGASTFANAGNVESNGTSVVSGLSGIANIGTIEVQSGSLSLSGPVSGTGTLKIDAGATLELVSGVSSGQTVMFGADTGVLKLDDPLDFHGTIAGISHTSQTDILRLEGLTAGHSIAASTSGAYDSAHDTTTLTILDGSSQLMTFTLDGDYSTSSWIVTDKGNGEYDIVDPPASNSQPLGSMVMHDPGPAMSEITIGHEGSSELAAGAMAEVTFADATGHLTLDDASNSQISVSGFTGDGTLEGSDQIDLKGIDHNSQSFAENYDATKGLLTVTDGNKTAALHFNGNYQAANFNFVSDGHGGTIVYDPPVPPGPAHTYDGFAFNFPAPVQAALQDVIHEVQDALAPLKDVLHLTGDANLQPVLGGAYGAAPGAGTTPHTIASIDPVAWQDSLKLLPSHTDLHV